MIARSTEVLWWLAYFGAASAFVFGGILASRAREKSTAFGIGLGSMGFGPPCAAVLGFILGFLVKQPDVAGEPGFIQALQMALGGFLVGIPSGIVGGLAIGILMAGNK